jgi:hypothetical protein
MDYEIKDFIGVFDGVFGHKLCDRYIEHYKDLEENDLVWPRADDPHMVSDHGIAITTQAFHQDISIRYILKDFTDIYWPQCQELYAKHYSILYNNAPHSIIDAKLQKTVAGEGYHVWHAENTDLMTRNRLLVFMLYLNDDFEGGETEFLYQKRRIEPKKDRLLIWPTSFTHTHKGDMVLEGEKYVLTGWVEYTGQRVKS